MASQSRLVRSSSRGAARANSIEAVVDLETAVEGFQAQLKDEERAQLQSLQTTPPNAQSIIKFTEQIDDANQKRRGKRIASGLSSFLQTIQQFSPAINIFVSSNPETAGLIWGSIKLTFLILANFTSYFKSFVNILDGFGSLCSRFSEYQLLFGTSTRLSDSICRFHTAVVSCCQALVVSTRRSVLSKVTNAILGSFESEMRPYVDGIKAKADEVLQDIAFVKAKSDRDEHRLHAAGRHAAASYRSLALAMFSKHEEQLAEAQALAKVQERKRRLEKLLKELSPYGGHNVAFHSTRNKRHHRTGEWVLNTQEFKDWFGKDGSTVLHITGKIGSGKSVLMSRVIEHLNSTRIPGQAISFFFCRFDDADSLECDTILRSLVYQLLHPFSFNDQESSDTRSIDAIKTFLEDHVDKTRLVQLYTFAFNLVKKWIIVLDGIDECPKGQRHMLFKFLSTVISHEESSGRLKIVFSSRETIDADIQQQFSSPPQISTGERQTRNDILIYAQDILEEKIETKELVLGDPGLVLDILHAIESREKGMFLWVFLTIEDICTRKTDANISKALLDIPMDLDITLNRALQRITKEKHSDAAKTIFQWTMVVRVPLKAEQLLEALSIEVGQKVWKPACRYNDIERLTLWCQNLVHIEKEDNTVRFSHHSIKDFLSRPDSESLEGFDFSYPESDHHVGQICLTYLNLDNLSRSNFQDEQQPSAKLSISGFSATGIATKTLQEALPDEIRGSAKRLMNRVMALRDRPQRSMPQTPACAELPLDLTARTTRDFSHTFHEYAERHWHSHIRFFTESSETYELFRGMIEGTMLADEMPWMDERWRESNRSLYAWQNNSLLAVNYAESIGNHVLIQHAFKIAAGQPGYHSSALVSCMRFLDDHGHLHCSEQCISRLQGLLRHQDLITVIRDHLFKGLGILFADDYWPPIGQPSDAVCDCSENNLARGVNADLCQVITRGYQPRRQPFLAFITFLVTSTSFNNSIDRTCEALQTTEAALLMGSTAYGKTILDLWAEGFLPAWFKINNWGWRFWTGRQGSGDILINDLESLERLKRLGIECYEMQRMATKALQTALGPTMEWDKVEEIFRLLATFGSDATDSESCQNMDGAINMAMNHKLTKEQTQRIVEVYTASVVNCNSSLRHLKIFSHAIQEGNWRFARMLSRQQPLLDTAERNDRVRVIHAALTCRKCVMGSRTDGRSQESAWFFRFCFIHGAEVTKVLREDDGTATGDDEDAPDSVLQRFLEKYTPNPETSS